MTDIGTTVDHHMKLGTPLILYVFLRTVPPESQHRTAERPQRRVYCTHTCMLTTILFFVCLLVRDSRSASRSRSASMRWKFTTRAARSPARYMLVVATDGRVSGTREQHGRLIASPTFVASAAGCHLTPLPARTRADFPYSQVQSHHEGPSGIKSKAKNMFKRKLGREKKAAVQKQPVHSTPPVRTFSKVRPHSVIRALFSCGRGITNPNPSNFLPLFCFPGGIDHNRLE